MITEVILRQSSIKSMIRKAGAYRSGAIFFQKRMLERQNDRWAKNYTYFFGNLTEEEMQYRDYFQTDVEQDPEDDFVDE